jgi:nucleoside-diphosphate-sugar epimerase
MSAVAVQPLIAVTGATGFIGRRLVPALARAGYRVRVLLRRDPALPEWRDLRLQVVAGDLCDTAAVERLVDGAQVVVHLAGLIKAARRSQFFAVNHQGAQTVAAAVACRAPQAGFLHVSTIAARQPQLSDYAASKRAGEEAVRELLGARATVLRPPAVYGPGDRETLLFFQLAQRRYVPLVGGPDARAAMIHADDLVSLMVALVGETPCGRVLTAADGRPDGYRWAEVFAAAAQAAGNDNPRLFQAPVALLRMAAAVGDVGRWLGSANMLSSQKLRELRHLDWSVSPGERAQPPGWAPRYTLETGFADTVAWYRAAGWLPGIDA